MVKKEKIVAITTNFGLGPVGKLSSIVNASSDIYEWYATGQKFDESVFKKDVFKKKKFTEDESEIKAFLEENGIKTALVVLKNKYARYLKSIGIKVVYVDSLPFMWTETDASLGKVPFSVDCYCAQKGYELNESKLNIFSRVENLIWVDPIVPILEDITDTKTEDFVLINLGGLHSPHGDGEEYVKLCIKPLIEILNRLQKMKVYVTCGSNACDKIKEILNYDNLEVTTLNQQEFLKKVKSSKLFFTSPGLTTIVETLPFEKQTILLPPQNLSQFYNMEYAKTHLKLYKFIEWKDEFLNLETLQKIDKIEGEIVADIYSRIEQLLMDETFKIDFEKQLADVLNAEYFENPNFCPLKNGTLDVLKAIEQVLNKQGELK